MNVEPELSIYDPSLPMSLALQNEINVNEQVKWVGRPNLRRSLAEIKLLFWLSIPILAFSSLFVFLATFALESSILGGVVLIGIGSIMFLIGLFFLVTPVLTYMMCRTTVYVVTNRRAIIVSGLFRSKLESFHEADLKRVDCRVGKQGIGSIIFLESVRTNNADSRSAGQPALRKGFQSIEQAKKVERLIRVIRS